jgi:hypothetical protein
MRVTISARESSRTAVYEDEMMRIERLDAWVYYFMVQTTPAIDHYLFTTEEERQNIPYPLPLKKMRVMMRAVRTLIEIAKIRENSQADFPVRISILDGGVPAPEDAFHTRFTNAGLAEVRADIKELRRAHKSAFRKPRKSRASARQQKAELASMFGYVDRQFRRKTKE